MKTPLRVVVVFTSFLATLLPSTVARSAEEKRERVDAASTEKFEIRNIEGWAVYTETMMCDEGFLDNDPLMRLIMLKWHLRGITNAMMDQAIHAGDMTRDEAMQLMIEGGFQEEREAAGKWVRAQLTSAQLSTYFVGYLEHAALRREVEQLWGEKFTLKKYHDTLLSFGSPPTKFARALMLGKKIPE